MGLKETILQKIKEEVQNDPRQVGYSAMSNSDKLLAINNPVQKSETIYYNEQAPISRILSGIAGTPNSIELSDLEAALTST